MARAPTKENYDVLERALASAQNFGESFVVFVSGLAVYSHDDKTTAQAYARKSAKNVGRERVVIKRISVSASKV